MIPVYPRSKIANLVLVAAAGLLLAYFVPAAVADSISGSCKAPTAIKYKSTTDGGFTKQRKHFVNIPNALVNFVQGGSQPNCVIVTFSSDSLADPGSAMIVGVELDGDTDVCSPSASYFALTDSSAGSSAGGAHAMNFVCPNVAPGAHTVHMKYGVLSGGGGKQATIIAHTTLVQYIE